MHISISHATFFGYVFLGIICVSHAFVFWIPVWKSTSVLRYQPKHKGWLPIRTRGSGVFVKPRKPYLNYYPIFSPSSTHRATHLHRPFYSRRPNLFNLNGHHPLCPLCHVAHYMNKPRRKPFYGGGTLFFRRPTRASSGHFFSPSNIFPRHHHHAPIFPKLKSPFQGHHGGHHHDHPVDSFGPSHFPKFGDFPKFSNFPKVMEFPKFRPNKFSTSSGGGSGSLSSHYTRLRDNHDSPHHGYRGHHSPSNSKTRHYPHHPHHQHSHYPRKPVHYYQATGNPTSAEYLDHRPYKMKNSYSENAEVSHSPPENVLLSHLPPGPPEHSILSLSQPENAMISHDPPQSPPPSVPAVVVQSDGGPPAEYPVKEYSNLGFKNGEDGVPEMPGFMRMSWW